MNRIKIYALAAIAILAACSTMEKPQTLHEQIVYANAGADAATKTLVDLTCLKYTTAGVCAEPSKLLHPARADAYLSIISKARLALRETTNMSSSGGTCLGQPSTPAACLQVAQSMLSEVQRILTDLQKQQQQ